MFSYLLTYLSSDSVSCRLRRVRIVPISWLSQGPGRHRTRLERTWPDANRLDGRCLRCSVPTDRLPVLRSAARYTLLLWWQLRQPRSQHRLVTKRRSVAKNIGCFQRLLFVCLFVNTITPERVNVWWWNLGYRRTVQKSRPPPGCAPTKMWRSATTLGKSV